MQLKIMSFKKNKNNKIDKVAENPNKSIYWKKNREIFKKEFVDNIIFINEKTKPALLIDQNIKSTGYSQLIMSFNTIKHNYKYNIYYTFDQIKKDYLKVKKGEVSLKIEEKNQTFLVFNIEQLLGKIPVYELERIKLNFTTREYNRVNSVFLESKIKQFFLNQFFITEFKEQFDEEKIKKGLYKNALVEISNETMKDINKFIINNNSKFKIINKIIEME